MPQYGDPKYWDERYTKYKDSTFDWLEDFKSLEPLLLQFIQKTDRILMLGCGNAELSEDMYDAGYQNITNIDISSVVIETMRERNADKTGMIWLVGDVTYMPEFESNSFDALLDKSTIDALLCAENSYVMTAKMLKEAQRVLKVGGYYIAVSYGNPESRAFHLEREFLIWDRKEFVLREIQEKKQELEEKKEEEKIHYIYVCCKN